MNLFDVLECGSIILSDKESGIFFTWNESSTLQAWREFSPGKYDLLHNSAIRVCSGLWENDYTGAVKRAKLWLKELVEDDCSYMELTRW